MGYETGLTKAVVGSLLMGSFMMNIALTVCLFTSALKNCQRRKEYEVVRRHQKAAKRDVQPQLEETVAAMEATVTAIENETCTVDVTDISEDLEVTFKSETERKKQQQKKDQETCKK